MSVTLRRIAIAACALALGVASARVSLAAEVDSPPPAGSALAKVSKGMPDDQVREVVGTPTSTNHYPTGKGWIPFYGWWGGDGYRTEWIYKGKGRVVFNQRPFSSRLKVIRVLYDPSEDGY
jgi:hypothetical protein